MNKETPNLGVVETSDVVEYNYYKSISNPKDYYIWISKSELLRQNKILKILHVQEDRLTRVYHCEQNSDDIIAVKRGSVVTEDSNSRSIHTKQNQIQLIQHLPEIIMSY